MAAFSPHFVLYYKNDVDDSRANLARQHIHEWLQTRGMTCQVDVSDRTKSRVLIDGSDLLVNVAKTARFRDVARWDDLSSADKSVVLFYSLQAVPYGECEEGDVASGFRRLFADGIYCDYSAVHDAGAATLRDKWASFSKCFARQPLGLVRDYFGDTIAYYFAWLDFYLMWLIPAVIMGFGSLAYSVYSLRGPNRLLDEACANGTKRLCGGSSAGCDFYKASEFFDNGGNVVHGILMSFWSVLFLSHWRRRDGRLAQEWCPPAHDTPCITTRGRLNRQTHMSILGLLAALCCAGVLSIILYRMAISAVFKTSPGLADITSSVTSGALSVVLIYALNRLSRRVAVWLTESESHTSKTGYDNSLIYKVFAFQFVTNYVPVFYVLFIKGQAAGSLDRPNRIFGLKIETCPNYGCFSNASIQVCIILLGQLIINNIVEILIPYVKTVWRRQQRQSCHGGLLDEYLEIVTQYGFVTLFAVVLPLSPLFALLNNVVEIRLDAKKLLLHARPVAFRVGGIGAWLTAGVEGD